MKPLLFGDTVIMYVRFSILRLYIIWSSCGVVITELLEPDLASLIPDTEVRHIVEQFTRLCEGTMLCHVNVSYPEVTFTEDGPMGTCCGDCSCEKDCHTSNDCCPDIIPRVLNIRELRGLYDRLTECHQVQIPPLPLSELEIESYEMVSKCPVNYDNGTIKEACERKYDFSADSVIDIMELTPVTDNSSEITYINMHCAVCNQADNGSLVRWNTEVACKDGPPFLSDSRNTLIKNVLETGSRCVLKTTVPKTIAAGSVKECQYLIDRCNVTGLYTAEDPSLMAACSSYTSVYKHYKNIHCYLCNGNSESTVEDKCPLVSIGIRPHFKGIFSQSEMSSKLNSVKDMCFSRSRLDGSPEECQPLFCSEMMWRSGMRCAPYYSYAHPISYEIRFTLIPRFELTQYKRFEEIRDMIEKTLLKPTRILCKLDVYLKLNVTEELLPDAIASQRLPALQIDVIAAVYNDSTSSDIPSVLKEVLEIYQVDFIDSNNFTIEYTVDENAMNKSVAKEEHMEINLIGSNIDNVAWVYIINKDNLVSLWFTSVFPQDRCLQPIRVNFLQMCAKIILPKDSYTVEVEGENTSRIRLHGIRLENDEFMFTTDRKLVLCAEKYFELLEQDIGNKISHSATLKPFMFLEIVYAVSLVFKILV